VSDEAYFHHELGVLALCHGNPEGARGELEASIDLRGLVGDGQGTVTDRRTLALVADRLAGRAAHQSPVTGQPPAAASAIPAAPAAPARPTVSTVRPAVGSPEVAFTKATAEVAPGGRPAGALSGKRGGSSTGPRRNLMAAGAGAILVAVLGTVVTLGATTRSGSAHGDPDSGGPAGSARQEDQGSGGPAGQPTGGAAATGGLSPATGRLSPATGAAHSSRPSASAGTPAPSDSASPGAGHSRAGGAQGGPPSGGGSSRPSGSPSPASSSPSPSSSSPAPSSSAVSQSPSPSSGGKPSASGSSSTTPIATTSGRPASAPPGGSSSSATV
jgi:hypothetical protein